MKYDARVRSWVLCASLALAGCSDRSVLVVPELPEGLAWLGLLLPGTNPEASSGLFPVAGGRAELSVEVPEDAEEVRLFGFSSADLARYAPPDPAELATLRLLPESSGHALMQASYSASGFLDGTSSFVSDSAPGRVSAQWRPACPDLALGEEKLAHVPCLEVPCAARATQTGCDFVLDAPFCGQRFEGIVGLDGTLTFSNQTVLRECRVLEHGRSSELSCTGPRSTLAVCPVSLYPPDWEAPELVQTSVELVPGLTASSGAGLSSHLRGLVRHESTLITLSSGVDGFGGQDCLAAPELVFVDVDRMEVVRTATAPACARALAYDPVLSALVVAHGAEVSRVSRLDLAGRVLSSVELPAELQPPEWFPNNVFVEPQSRAIIVPFTAKPRAPGEEVLATWWVLVLDADTLVLRGAPVVVPRLTETILAHRPGSVALPHGDSTLSLFDTRGPTLGRAIATGALCGPAGAYRSGFHDDALGRFFLASRGSQSHGVTQIEADGSACQTGYALESPRSPFGIARWAADPNLILVGLDGLPANPPLTEAALAFFDIQARRFLVGEQPVGLGSVKELLPDGSGGMVMILPSEAKVVRVRPR